MGRASRAFACSAIVATVLATALSSTGFAEPGDGIRAGGWIIHPSIEGNLGYQTNVFLLDRPNRTEHPDDWILRLVPQIVVERSGGRARLRLYALYDWRQYAFNSKLDAHDNVGLGITTAFDEDRDLALLAEDQFRIQSRPNELDLFGQYHRDANAAKLSTIYRPGTALEVHPGVFWNYDRFTDSKTTFAERHTAGAIVDARWAFLSRTVFAVTGEGGRVLYSQSPVLPAMPTEKINSGSTYWRVDAGLVGQVSPKINVTLKGGYGQALYSRNESLNDSRGVTATAKGDWAPRQNIAVGAGYERTFQDVFFTNFDVIDRVFAKYRHTFREETIFEGSAIAEWQQYSKPYERRDFVVRIDPGVRRLLSNWADIGLAYRYERRFSRLQSLGGPASVDAPNAYTSHTVMFTANLKW